MDKELAKALARLTALKSQVSRNHISKKYADEYNSIIEILEKTSGEVLTEFKIPSQEIKPIPVSYSKMGTDYSAESYCDKEYFLMKLDGVLGYFTLLLQPVEVKKQMGFTVANND